MPTVTIPLVGSITERGPDGKSIVITNNKDQRFLNCIFRKRVNPGTGAVSIAVEKRNGTTSSLAPAGGAAGRVAIYLNMGAVTASVFAVISAFYNSGTGNSNIYVGNTNIGTVPANMSGPFIRASFNGINYLCWVASDGTGWYLAGDATYANTTGDTHSSAVVSNIPSTAGFHVGQAVTISGVPVGSRILTVDSATQITLTASSSTTISGTAIAHEAISKIIDAQYPSANAVGTFAYLDGYIFVHTNTGQVYNCDINNPDSWTATSYITANTFGNVGMVSLGSLAGCTVIRYRSYILAFKADSFEVFYNAGNPTGSPLGMMEQLAQKVGISLLAPAWTELDGVLYWISGSEGMIALYRMNGMTAEKISTADMDNLMATDPGYGLSSGYWNGVPVLVLGHMADASSSLIYQIDTKTVSLWSGAPIGGLAITQSTDHFMVDNIGTGGAVFKMTPITPAYDDAGSTITVQIRTSRLDFGTNKRKFVNRITLLGSDVQSTGTVTLEKSDDDYASWQTLGTFDLTSMNPFITRCGSYIGGRAYRLTHTASAAFAAASLQIDYAATT